MKTYFYFLRLISAFYLLIILHNNAISQTYIDKNNPIEDASFKWDYNNELLITFKLKLVENSSNNSNAIIISEIRPSLLSVTVYGQGNPSTIEINDASNLYRANNTIVAKIPSNRIDLKNTNNWKYISIKLKYNLEGEKETFSFPLYINKNEITSETPNNLNIKIESLEKNSGENKATLNLSTSNDNFYVLNVEIIGQNGTNFVDSINSSGSRIGKKPVINIDLISSSNIVALEDYNIKIKYSITGVTNETEHPNSPFTQNSIKLIEHPSFEITGLNYDNNPVNQDYIFLNQDTSIDLQINTNVTNNNSLYVSNSAKITAKITWARNNLMSAGAISQLNDKYITLSNGSGTLSLPFSSVPDNIYYVEINGKVNKAGGGEIRLLNHRKITIYKDTRNVVTSLKFDYSNQNINISFGLKDKVDKSKVKMILADNTEITSTLNNDKYLITKKLSDFPAGSSHKIKLKVSQIEIFEFEFFVMQSNLVETAIKEGFEKKFQGVEQKRYLEKLNNSDFKASLKQEITNQVQAKFTSSGDNQSFKNELEKLVEDYIDDLAQRTDKNIEKSKFWESSTGKVVKTIGGFALKFLNVILI